MVLGGWEGAAAAVVSSSSKNQEKHRRRRRRRGGGGDEDGDEERLKEGWEAAWMVCRGEVGVMERRSVWGRRPLSELMGVYIMFYGHGGTHKSLFH